MISRVTLALVVLLGCLASAGAEEPSIQADVVYGHKLGLAMTMDVFPPDGEANGAGLLFMVSGGWYSNWTPPEKIRPLFAPMLERGFTVFAVRHGSSPKFSIPEAVSDVRRSVRYVRHNAARFAVDPERLGVYGYSAGGHLSLVLGAASDEGQSSAEDPVESTSDRVAAVVAFVAPTDLRIMVSEAKDRLPAYEQFPALTLGMKEAAEYSPLLHASADDPPTLLIAGDKDDLVPVDHSHKMLAAMKEKNAPCELLVIEGAGHTFAPADMQRAVKAAGDWFEKHLSKK
jgi:acetyl esterase/lipase